jgi:hypothetical protein
VFAGGLFAIHLVVVLMVMFSWLFSTMLPLYTLTLVTTLLSELTLGYCPLTRWEFILRHSVNPRISEGTSYLSYYAYRILPKVPDETIVAAVSLIFLSVSVLVLALRLILS